MTTTTTQSSYWWGVIDSPRTFFDLTHVINTTPQYWLGNISPNPFYKATQLNPYLPFHTPLLTYEKKKKAIKLFLQKINRRSSLFFFFSFFVLFILLLFNFYRLLIASVRFEIKVTFAFYKNCCFPFHLNFW